MNAVVYGMQQEMIQRMLDYDYVCGNHPSVYACVGEWGTASSLVCHWGREMCRVPVYRSLDHAIAHHPDIDTCINAWSFRTATSVIRQCFSFSQIGTIVTIAEGIPERDTREIIAIKPCHVRLIGPATVGWLGAGQFRWGNTAGTMDNIVSSRLFRAWSVGLVSKSGGMLNELCAECARHTDGIHTAIAIGGDRYPYSTFADIVRWYETIDAIKMIVVFGEVGTEDECEVAEMVRRWEVKKPVVVWVTGESADHLPKAMQFGHAGAKATTDRESARFKNAFCREAGCVVPESYADLPRVLRDTFGSLWWGVYACDERVPEEIMSRVKDCSMRKKPLISTRISDERGDELTYRGIPVSDYVAQGDIARVLGALRLGKKNFSDRSLRLIQTILIVCADHGPAVSGAINTIVTARAGKDAVSSVIAGLATIGPRFGWAISGCMRMLWDAHCQWWNAQQIVDYAKKQGVLIPWIGHKIKSLYNPDVRCQHLADCAWSDGIFFPLGKEIEVITTAKKPTLILNVDGHIACLLLDMMRAEGFGDEEIASFVSADLGNCFFVLARTIWLLGHFLDQVRHDEGLVRLSWDDVWYE